MENQNIPEAPLGYVAVKWEEYKELLIIKGKYEELSKYHQPLIIEYTDPMLVPPYKTTC